MRSTSLMNRWFPWTKTHLVKQVGGEVARQCHATLWQRLSDKTYAASIAEIRGYARAYSAEIVGNEIAGAFARHRLDLGLQHQVADSATDQLIAMVIRDVLCEQPPRIATNVAA